MEKTTHLDIVRESVRENKIVAFPTETSYGLLTNALNKNSVQRVFDIKKRDYKKPLSIFVKDSEMAEKYIILTDEIKAVFEHFFPGPLTVICRAKKELFGITKNQSIALRISSEPKIIALFEAIDMPLTATSANISSEGDMYSDEAVYQRYLSEACQPDLIFLGGEIPHNKPSTIVDLTRDAPRIVRSGEISGGEIGRILAH